MTKDIDSAIADAEKRFELARARVHELKAKKKSALRKKRNSALFALGVCLEKAFSDPEDREVVLRLVAKHLSGKLLERGKGYLDALDPAAVEATAVVEEKAAPAAPAPAASSPLPPGVSLAEGVRVGPDGLLVGNGVEWTPLPGLPADKRAEFLAMGAKETQKGEVYIPRMMALDGFKIRPEWLVAPKEADLVV